MSFEKLSVNGCVTIVLEQIFWEARFGTSTDKFGIQWILNMMSLSLMRANRKEKVLTIQSTD